MKSKKGFTLIELLTAIAVSALLLSLLLPSLYRVRSMAREAKQKVQFSAIDQALLAFRNDYGDYPPSEVTKTVSDDYYYCGAQKIAEAFFGLDLLGFYPYTDWDGNLKTYTEPPGNDLSQRKGRYLDMDSVNVVRVGDLYGSIGQLAAYTYVLCDVFARMPIIESDKVKKVGIPVLYFKADTSKPGFSTGQMGNNVYSIMDNLQIVVTQRQYDQDDEGRHRILENFYSPDYKIYDEKVTTKPWPHKPDSYILISAGIDGLYGTNDDITNFGD